MNLHEAAGDGDVAEVRQLMAAGAEVDEKGEHGMTPLHWAATDGHV
jgi:ankyrin repeat protein